MCSRLHGVSKENYFGKTTLSKLNRDSKFDLYDISSQVYCEDGVLDHVITEAGWTEGRCMDGFPSVIRDSGFESYRHHHRIVEAWWSSGGLAKKL
uniref:Uncharacterized protein n=1 Tax=Timema douglasi TaxID=61478 RepID=A0A7R8VVR2_TIMDO|nr:unnamed protein product [Timema douglasi]